MKNAFDNFVELLVKGDFFFIFLIVMMIVIISVIIYLIKLQVSDNYIEEDEETDIIKSVEETLKEDSIMTYDEEIIDDEIQMYEDNQEEMAIISASELESRLKAMKETGELDKHEEEIKNYELEQENKAIISYEELLKRATTNTISYESEENLGGVRVGKVDTSKIEINSEDNNTPYYKEEAFLSALKEFRSSL